MDQLATPADVSAATSDSLVRWGSQALDETFPHPGGFALRIGSAVGVYAPQLNRAERLLITGDAADCAAVIDHVLRHTPNTNVIGTSARIHDTAARLPGARTPHAFGWMELDPGTKPSIVDTSAVRWLTADELVQVEALLNKANPDSYVRPSLPAPQRWAGIHAYGRLVATAATAWPSRDVGFIAGVATDPDHRGRGHSTAACAFLLDALRAAHKSVALMVDAANDVAIRMYQRLGFDYRSITVLRRP